MIDRAAMLSIAAAAGLAAAPAPGLGQESPGADRSVDYAGAVASVERDLAEALAELAQLRAEIAAERPELARATAEVASELRTKRLRAELAKQERDALLHDLETLSERVRGWRDEQGYIQGMLDDFAKQQEAQVPLSGLEGALLREGAIDAAYVGAVVSRLEGALGGRASAGSALDEDGVVHGGRFVEAGPVAWFVADGGEVAGLVREGRGLVGEVVAGTASAGDLEAVLGGEAADLAFDPTLGNALALRESGGGLVEHVRQGGLWIYPILLLALVAAAAAVAKWLQLRRVREFETELVQRVVSATAAGNLAEAREVVEGIHHPAAALLRRGIDAAGGSREAVEEALYEEFLAAQPRLQRGLPLIAIASATAPLLGLLGTVTGMIHTFRLIKVFGTGDAKSLASGISEALVTTEFGLAVAIPALLLHALLSRKVQGIRSTMEMVGLAFTNGVCPVPAPGAPGGARPGPEGGAP